MAAGIGCLSAILLDKTWILALIYMAIRGVENAQPLRWMGHEIQPYGVAARLSMQEFVSGGIKTGGMFAIGTICGAVALLSDVDQRNWRFVLLAISTCCLAGTVWLLMWCKNSVLPAMSPVLPEVVGDQPAGNVFLAGLLIACAAAAGATWLRQKPRTETVARPDASAGRTRLLLDDIAVIGVCLTTVVIAIGNDAWNMIRYDSTLAA